MFVALSCARYKLITCKERQAVKRWRKLNTVRCRSLATFWMGCFAGSRYRLPAACMGCSLGCLVLA